MTVKGKSMKKQKKNVLIERRNKRYELEIFE